MEPGRPRKRQRTLGNDDLPTPPALECEIERPGSKPLRRATNVLNTAATALSHVTQLYETDPGVRRNLMTAVDAVVTAHLAGKKLVVCGVGKSAFIAMKLVATCKSLGIGASFMHACEAAHGDLGDIRSGDVVLFVSFSGKTPELVNLLPHLSDHTEIIAISSQTNAIDCMLLDGRGCKGTLLPAPIPESEQATFGVGAPTTSTTVALAVADMLALCVADTMHNEKTQQIFQRNHPGGAIGMNHKEVEKLKNDGIEVSILELPSPSISAEDS